MGLFGKKDKTTVPLTEAAQPQNTGNAPENLSIKILGGGCQKCNDLEAATRDALTQLGVSMEIEHVTDFAQIAAYGVMTTPALVVNNKVLSYGKVLKTDEALKLLQKALS